MASEARKQSEFLNQEFSASERLINLKGNIVKRLVPTLLAVSVLLSGQLAFATNPTGPATTPGANGIQSRGVAKAAPSDMFMVQLNSNADRDDFDTLLKDMHGTLVDTIQIGPMQILVVQAEPGTAAETEKKLAKSKEVKSVERNRTYKLNQATNDVLFSTQWDLMFMQYPAGRQIGLNYGSVVYMYFLDTGFNPAFGETTNFVRQYDFSRPWHPDGAPETPHDSGFHGTSTATVTCDTDNIFGFAGMSNFEGNRTSLTELRISNDGESANGLNIVYALAFLYGQMASGIMPPGPINLSFGQTPPFSLNNSQLFQNIGGLLQQQSSLLVLAAGNDGIEDSSPEINCRRVASISQNGLLSTFSEFGPFNAAAPGDLVPCYQPMNGAQGGMPVFISGTSFSAPRWCAAIAIVMAALPANKRTAGYADQIVLNTATITSQGWHVPNLLAALQLARTIK